MRWVWLAGILAALATGCASKGVISVADSAPARNPAGKNAVTIRLLPYADGRPGGNPRMIGTGAQFIQGPTAPGGTDIILNRDVAELVTHAMRQRLKDAGYQLVEDGNAQFEMRGTVKDLTYNIAARDEVTMSVATELKDVTTGSVLWAGVVDEKNDRYPGTMGDFPGDVAAFLKLELGVVTQKTTDAITAVLTQQHPELFPVAPGGKPIPGVTVLTAPAAASAVRPAVPVVSAAKGVLTISTKPSRAKIYVGGVYYGLSPLRLELEPGVLEVTASLDRYKNAIEKVSVRQGETTELELTLRR